MADNGEEKNLFRPPGIEPRLIALPVHSLVAVSTELTRVPVSVQNEDNTQALGYCSQYPQQYTELNRC
jgi:hypothetical protein